MRFGSVHRDHLACLCIYTNANAIAMYTTHEDICRMKTKRTKFLLCFFLSSFALFILSLLSSPSSSTSVV